MSLLALQLSTHADFTHCCCPSNSQSVLVHQLSRHSSQNPFRKNRGRVQRVAFHPLKPFFFVATQNAVRIYNLAKQVRATAVLHLLAVLVQVFYACVLATQNAERSAHLQPGQAGAWSGSFFGFIELSGNCPLLLQHLVVGACTVHVLDDLKV
jgi:hypothetical protein